MSSMNSILETRSVSALDSRRVAVLGSTGSIGENTLSVIDDNLEAFSVFALSTFQRTEVLQQQIFRYKPSVAVIANANLSEEADSLQRACQQAGIETQILLGPDNLDAIASDVSVDIVVAGIVGAAGLSSTLAAARAGKQVLLANKEAIVMGGSHFVNAVREGGAQLLPLDSEHNAIFQCLPEVLTASTVSCDVPSQSARALKANGIEKILLTGSGGPFRETPIEQFKDLTPEQACDHPNWSMGRKISVDSATMMNKGLELIEACWLFACDESVIDIIVHPQSIIHSMVQYSDGSVLAQMGRPDMRTPIAHALAWPTRVPNQVKALDWQAMGSLTFQGPDAQRFPALTLAREVARLKNHTAIVMNAANEVLVGAFLSKEIRFDQITVGVERALDQLLGLAEPSSLEEIMAIDHETRRVSAGLIQKFRA